MKRSKRLILDPLFFSLLINVSVLFAALVLHKPFFEENDDVNFCLLAEGAFGSVDPHIICSNVLLGRLYGVLHLMPGLRWHSILQYLFLFIALTSVSYVFLLRSERPGKGSRGRLICILFLLAVYYEAYVSLQFTKTAAIVSGAGYILLLYAAEDICRGYHERKRRDIVISVIAYLLLLYGILMRASSFKLATLLLMPAGIYVFFRIVSGSGEKTEGESKGAVAGIKRGVPFVIMFVAVLCMLVVTQKIDGAAYAKGTDWGNFREYQLARAGVIDLGYEVLDYDVNSGILDELGISRNDAEMYLTWQFGDDNVLDTAKLKQLVEHTPQRTFDTDDIKALAQSIYDDLFVFTPLIMGIMLFAVYGLIVTFIEKKKGQFALLIMHFILLFGIFVYYQYKGRWNHRVVYSSLFILMLLIVYVLSSDTASDKGETAGTLSGLPAVAGMIMITAAACLGTLLGNRFDYNDHRRNAPDYTAFFEDIKEHKDTLYVGDTFTFQEMGRYDVFKPYGTGELDSFVTVGSWYGNTPPVKQLMGRYGYTNPFDALAKGAGEGNVILVDNLFADKKLTFLNEHYGSFSLNEQPAAYGLDMYRIKRKGE
ncbi:MAG: hypothetical protein K6F34_01730 [Lachnospiraceae bacterium]|nr:hypothetical protein [Lachnospiraceae bacterium]